MVISPVHEAADKIKLAKHLVVITGAGFSVESGIPDFRSSRRWWRRIDPVTVATVDALEYNYNLFHGFYSTRVEHLKTVSPHPGHHILSKWEQDGRLQLIATQNVDGLHQLAGNRRVQELHGSIRTFRCHQCGHRGEQEIFLGKIQCSCGGNLRPNIILFGESLPSDAWAISAEAIRNADVVLVMGTSLQVAPVNQLPFLTSSTLILINQESIGLEHQFDIVIQDSVVKTLTAIERTMSFR
ncbi:MAG: Sir2 family NAD-dependent protein deacetylase [Paenibacillaceae bacterium]